LIDTWIVLRELEENRERNRGLYVVKSRGMAHSNQVLEFFLTDRGVRLVPAALGASRVLTRSATKKNSLAPVAGQKKQKRRGRQRSAMVRIRKTAAADRGKPFLAKAAGENR
jgi:circadian clock protein KaiC